MEDVRTTAITPASTSYLYALLILLSVVISWGIFSQFLILEDASLSSFFAQAFATPTASLVSSDVILTAVIFVVFAHIELKRLGMPANRLALYVLITFTVGVCGSLSAFLYQRERWLERDRRENLS